MTVYHTAKIDELQPVQKEVVQLRLATFIDFYFGSLALVLSRFMKEGKLNYKEKIKFRTENLITWSGSTYQLFITLDTWIKLSKYQVIIFRESFWSWFNLSTFQKNIFDPRSSYQICREKKVDLGPWIKILITWSKIK